MVHTGNRLGSIRASLMSSRHGDLTPNQFDPLFCAIQVAKGMAYLHSQDITHRDLKVFITIISIFIHFLILIFLTIKLTHFFF